jgi:hypothetical protein
MRNCTRASGRARSPRRPRHRARIPSGRARGHGIYGDREKHPKITHKYVYFPKCGGSGVGAHLSARTRHSHGEERKQNDRAERGAQGRRVHRACPWGYLVGRVRHDVTMRAGAASTKPTRVRAAAAAAARGCEKYVTGPYPRNPGHGAHTKSMTWRTREVWTRVR